MAFSVWNFPQGAVYQPHHHPLWTLQSDQAGFRRFWPSSQFLLYFWMDLPLISIISNCTYHLCCCDLFPIPASFWFVVSCRISEAFDKGFLWLGHFVRPLPSRAVVVCDYSSTPKSTQLQLVCSDSWDVNVIILAPWSSTLCRWSAKPSSSDWPCHQIYSSFVA